MRTWTPPQNPDALSDTQFIHYLAAVPVVTLAEGVRGVTLLDDSLGPPDMDFNARLAALKQRRAWRNGWPAHPDRILDRGTLAFMLRHITGTEPSFNERLANLTGLGARRYALRTCVDAGLLPYGQTHQAVTGGELLSALARAESDTP